MVLGKFKDIYTKGMNIIFITIKKVIFSKKIRDLQVNSIEKCQIESIYFYHIVYIHKRTAIGIVTISKLFN